MAKETLMKEYMDDAEDALDYFDGSPDEGMMGSMMESLMETHHQQTMMAIELTKVALSKNSDAHMSEEKVFDVFKRAFQVIAESSPLNNLIEEKA